MSEAIDYVSLRSQNIEKNQEFLRQLGLDGPLGWRDDHNEKKNKRSRQSLEINEDTRKLSRLRGIAPEKYVYSSESVSTPVRSPKMMVEIEADEESPNHRPITATQLREYIDATNQNHSEMISNEVFDLIF